LTFWHKFWLIWIHFDLLLNINYFPWVINNDSLFSNKIRNFIYKITFSSFPTIMSKWKHMWILLGPPPPIVSGLHSRVSLSLLELSLLLLETLKKLLQTLFDVKVHHIIVGVICSKHWHVTWRSFCFEII